RQAMKCWEPIMDIVSDLSKVEGSMEYTVKCLEDAMREPNKSEKEERTRYQRTAEEFGNSQIDYLEDELEERKQNQVTAEVFADKELDKLESQLQEQKDKRRFIEKYASVEILKLEDEVNDCLHLKDVLESEATSLSALTALDELHNTVSCLQTRIVELETINSRHEVYEQHQLTDNDRRQLDSGR
ncbi:hypothetical protein MAR_032249, partial [Mya arenaria]